ncbi:nucleotidyltransferase domain-containing protein [Dehalococcoidia bacterium]|nr:nucleotidyltransferase domain-containing protein [Dehalococcoidia bacterium]MCL0076267.1 nucleotidyltransferase domain-containing protein [Dehalococcoidia bacterium]
MARTAAELTVEELEVYRRAARCRKWREPQERRRRAWVLARRAADLLRERFRARRVVVFGSLVHEACFTPWSDVDLAAWGLRPEDTFRALGAVQYLDADIEVNLIDVATCSPSLLAVIELEGVEV